MDFSDIHQSSIGDIVEITSRYSKVKMFPGTVFEVPLDRQLVQKQACVLLKAIIPYSWYNLHTGNDSIKANNIFYIQIGANQKLPVEIPVGNYTLNPLDDNNFQTTVKNVLNTVDLDGNGTTATWTLNYSTITNKITIENNLIDTQWRLCFDEARAFRLAKMMGFTPYENTTYVENVSLTSINVCQVSGPDTLYIRTNMNFKEDVAGRNGSDTFTIPLTSNPGGLIVFECNEDLLVKQFEYENQEIDKIDIAITNGDDDSPVGGATGLNGMDCTFVFKFF